MLCNRPWSLGQHLPNQTHYYFFSKSINTLSGIKICIIPNCVLPPNKLHKCFHFLSFLGFGIEIMDLYLSQRVTATAKYTHGTCKYFWVQTLASWRKGRHLTKGASLLPLLSKSSPFHSRLPNCLLWLSCSWLPSSGCSSESETCSLCILLTGISPDMYSHWIPSSCLEMSNYTTHSWVGCCHFIWAGWGKLLLKLSAFLQKHDNMEPKFLLERWARPPSPTRKPTPTVLSCWQMAEGGWSR